ncbi:NACHT domain-containing protein [Leptolyngbya sp. AN03gr2]|uniref:NACHT domain-containing protein n=1 Tax=unclassified Leptolyngbya TaxID=2650499 RepID=UPI003D31EA08
MLDFKLEDVFNRIESGEPLSKRDLQVLERAVRSQQVTIQGNADRTVIVAGNGNVVGDRNLVVTGSDAEALRTWMGKRPWSEKRLLGAVRNQVESRLKQSLHNAVFIRLGRELQPGRVKRPWDSLVKIGDSPAKLLPDFMTLLEVFEEPEIAGKLLILGKPGAGKTTTLLELAQALCNQAEQSAEFPIPVLFNLSNWKDNQQPIQDWLTAELSVQYGVAKHISRPWLRDGKLLLMLDGLDELRSSDQAPCINAINALLQSQSRPHSIVVCSRDEEYCKHEKIKLELNAAIYIEPLKDEQIYHYLEQLQRQDLWNLIQGDWNLRELVRTPLWLSMLVIAQPELEFLDWRQPTTEGRFRALLNAYIRQMMKRPVRRDIEIRGSLPTERKTVDQLVFLAQQMQRESETEFLIEAIQPSWLPERSFWQFVYDLLNRLLIGFALAISFAVPLYLSNGIISSVLAALVGFCFGAMTRIKQKIQTVETLRWSWRSFGQGCKSGIEFGVTISESLLRINHARTYLSTRKLRARVAYLLSHKGMLGIACLIAGVMLGAISCPLFGLMSGIEGGSDIEEKIIPNQGILKSRNNLLTFVLIWELIIGVLLAITVGVIQRSFDLTFQALVVGTSFGMALGLLLGLELGGRVCIQHLTLRVFLWCLGCTPWNYARFLDYCTERLFLQRVGGRYRFIHRLLQEHFAAMPLERG